MSEHVVDLQEALERVQDDKELLIELFDIFMEDYAQKRKELDDVVNKKDFAQLKNIAHSIKGASSNISAKKIFASFLEMENVALNGDIEKITSLLKNVDGQYEELVAEIDKLKKELK